MENKQTLNHLFATIADGALLIWWGVVIIIDPLTIGMGAIGTGLILLGVNAARILTGIPTKGRTTYLGVIALLWGVLGVIFGPTSEESFALLLIVIGLATIVDLLAHPMTETEAA